MSNSTDDARRVAQEILSIEPTFSISAYAETQPYKDSKTLESIVGALRDAGLPD
jgi:hypothetical protein